MDPEAFLDIANQVIKLKMFPYFDIAHSLLCALSVKEDLGTGAHEFSRKHPLACWLSTMLIVYSGGMVAAGLLGEPILAPLKNTPQLLVATACWYIVSIYFSIISIFKFLNKNFRYSTLLLISAIKSPSFCPSSQLLQQ